MAWQITEQNALFAISILAFAWSGYRRGWKRETVSLLFIALGLVFLILSGGAYLARFLYQLLLEMNLTEQQLMASHARFVLITTIIAFAIIIVAGYVIGRRTFPQPLLSQDRVLGIIPGIITGALVAAYLTYYIIPSTQTSVISSGMVFLNLIPSLMANFTVVVIFVVALVAILIGLAATRPKKGSITVTQTTKAEKK